MFTGKFDGMYYIIGLMLTILGGWVGHWLEEREKQQKVYDLGETKVAPQTDLVEEKKKWQQD